MPNVRNKFVHATLLMLGFFVLLYTYFSGYARYQYLVPPGDDSLRHMTQAQEIVMTGRLPDPVSAAKSANLVPDPPLFHILMASASEITGVGIVPTFQFLGRLIAIFVPFAAYFLTRKIFKNSTLALISFLVLVFSSPQPLQIYNEGTYLNIIGAHIYMVFGLAFLPEVLAGRSPASLIRSLALCTIFFSAVVLSHPVSAIYLTLLFVGLLLVCLVQGMRKKDLVPFRNIAILFVAVLFIAATQVWNYYAGDLIRKGIALVQGILGGQSLAEASNALNFIPAELRTPASLDTFLGFLGPLLIILGLGGILLFVFRRRRSENALLMLWLFIFIVGSQSSFLQLPYRFARDLFLPLAIVGAFFVYDTVVRFRRTRLQLLPVVGIALALLSQILFGPMNFAAAARYNGLVRLQDVDEEALQWINEHTKESDTFLGSPFVSTSWGSYVSLITGRKVLDGLYCGAHQPDYITRQCDVIYRPDSLESMQFYRDNAIDYVYAGHPFVCCFIWQDRVNWDFQPILSQTSFLRRVFFASSKNVGSVAIFQVDKNRLAQMLASQ